MNENYLNELEQLLSRNEVYTVEKKLNKNKVAELAHKYDPELIDLLAGNAGMRRLFFIETAGKVLVFNKDKFIQFISNKEFLPDSYTTYKNKIGLGAGTELLTENKAVVLNWPYKDCVLEGGQDKEDAKRDEVFFNEVLAPDQIDRLLDEKVLTGWKRYDKDGEHATTDFLDTDNLIIRGNNLLALHSLKRRFGGKVKLIYIDPPYNTNGDTFGYNDRFNHSTWLTFMRNRLEVAKQLLAPDGIIFIQIDYIEFAYLKVLADEVFGIDKALPHVTVKTATPAGFKVINPGFINVSEHLLIYVRDNKNVIKDGYVAASYQTDYSKYVTDKTRPVEQWEVTSIKEAALREAGHDDIKAFKLSVGNDAAPRIIDELVSKFALKHAKNVFATYGPHKPSKTLQEAIEVSKKKPTSVVEVKREGSEEPYYLLNGRLLAFYSAKLQKVDGELVPTQRLTDFWSDMSWDAISNEGNVTLINGKKPERLLQRIIELTTEPGDIVLDYHLGSGTTAAVAHKLGRQYIGVEQLDYGANDVLTRLQNVIKGDPTGVSRVADWHGGGSFVYAHLMDLGNRFIERVKHASSDKELEDLLEQAKKSSFLSYKVDPEKINPGDKDFASLSMVHKKQLLLELVDQNHLYVNYSEIDDTDYGVSAEDKKLNKQFYKK